MSILGKFDIGFQKQFPCSSFNIHKDAILAGNIPAACGK